MKPVKLTPYNIPSVFTSKPFQLSTSKTFKPYTPILTKYSNPGIDYRARYNIAKAENRNLSTRVSKVQSDLDTHRKTHAEEQSQWVAEKAQYKQSPGYSVDKVSSDIVSRYSKAAKIFSPSVNGIRSIGGAGETASRAGAVVMGLLLVGLIIGRIE